MNTMTAPAALANTRPAPRPSRERRRDARVLIGWMEQEKALRVLAGRNRSANDPELLRQVAAAQEAVAARAGRFAPAGAVYDIPEELNGHVAELWKKPEFALYRKHKWDVKMADLSKVCAVQEIVHLDHAVERFEDVQPGDLDAVARVCLPLQRDTGEMKIHWSEEDNHWIIASDNPNLHVSAHFSEPQRIGGGRTMPGFGFCVETQLSFVQVVLHRGRYVLRDGYHRALGLAARGITQVPVLYREYGEFESLNLDHGNLAEPTYLGDNPATILDYLDDTVSGAITLSAKKTLIVIEAKRYSVSC
jgi:hypothetical protein